MSSAPIPASVGVALDRDTHELAGGRLVGGTPRRLLRLSASGQLALAELRSGVVSSPSAGQLARRLTDAGLAHPRPGTHVGTRDVTVVVPVRDRHEQLARCLRSLAGATCVVVDDGSSDPALIADLAGQYGARLVRRASAGGPSAARNDGIAGVETDLVAFLDSDCVASTGWLDRLAGHFADPLVGAVAPRVLPASRGTSRRYRDAVGLHDLGSREARVRPLGRVGFVPTAALVVRRAALAAIGGFDSALRYGEDVDLVWRLDEAGWRVRYDPAVEIAHDEPAGWAGRLARRFRYGTAAAPLAKRHPDVAGHLVVAPWPLAAVAGTLAGRPVVAAAAGAVTLRTTRRALARAGAKELSATGQAASALAGTWRGVSRYCAQFGVPLIAVAAWRSGSRQRAALAALVVAAPVADWFTSRPGVGVGRYVAGRVADDAAYGVGVYAGCLEERTAAPLRVVRARRAGERGAR
ncbi:MAG TPA: mycofactocin biosynthesis glycosyltransferase MftF [Mycobacteriales bacterium]|nr:mycofactocin biosynthesis glycosyltransferase MftF [Mycobacteriales bacterium]